MNTYKTYDGYRIESRISINDHILEVATVKRSDGYATLISKLKPLKIGFEIINSEIVKKHTTRKLSELQELHKQILKTIH